MQQICQEQKPQHVIGPSSVVFRELSRADFTPKKDLVKKNNGTEISTRVVKDGIGMAGLEDRVENQEWAGIFNHCAKTAGASLELGRLLQLNGQHVDLQLMIDTVMLSHTGRRQMDEASWYPQEVINPEEKKADTPIGLKNLKGRISQELLSMIAVHGLGLDYPYDETKTWNQKLPMYLDFRIGQNAMSMDQRFKDLQRGVESGRFSQQFLDDTKEWASNVQSELFKALNIANYEVVKGNPANLRARINMAVKLGKFTTEQAQKLRSTKLYRRSGIDTDVLTASGLSEDEFIKRLQLVPEDINDMMLQPNRWERYVRRLYVNDAEDEVFERLSQLKREISDGKEGSKDALEKEFPENSWWGKYVRDLHGRRNGRKHLANKNKRKGFARGQEYYSKVEEKRNTKPKTP